MKTESPRKPSPKKMNQKDEENRPENHNSSKSSIPLQDIYSSYKNNSFSTVTQKPIPSKAYSIEHAYHASEVKNSVILSSQSDYLKNNHSEPNDITFEKDQSDPKSIKTLSEKSYSNMLSLMKWARYSILINCYTDILTLLIPVFICCIQSGVKGVRELDTRKLLLYILYLVISSLPYIAAAYLVLRVELYVILSFFFFVKSTNLIIVIVLVVRTLATPKDQRVRLMIDFNTNYGISCVCC